MTGAELKAIRLRLYGKGVPATVKFGRAIGYSGTDASVAMSVRRAETRDKVPGPVAMSASSLALLNVISELRMSELVKAPPSA